MLRRFPLVLSAACAAWMISGWQPISLLSTRYDDARLVELAVLATILLCGLAAGAWPKGTAAQRRWSPIFLCIAFFALGAVSVARSAYPGYAFAELGLFASLAIAAVMIHQLALSDTSDQLRRHLLTVLSIGGIVLGFQLYIELIAAVVTQDTRGLAWSWLPFTNQRYFAKAACWALPLLWLLPRMGLRHSELLRAICAIASVAIGSQLIGTASRGALGAMLISAVFAAAVFGPLGRSYARWQLVSLLAGFAAWKAIELWSGLNTSDHIASDSSSGRDLLYAAALRDIVSAPWLGIGPMHFSVYDRHPDIAIAGPHSLPLQIAAEWGLPAAALALSLISLWFFTHVRHIRRLAADSSASTYTSIEIALFSALLVAGIHSLVANVVNDPVSQTMAVLCAGLMLLPQQRSPAIRSRSLPGTLAIAAMIAICITGLSQAMRLGYACAQKDDSAGTMRGFGGMIYPRLWSQGFIPLSQTCPTDSPPTATLAPATRELPTPSQ